MSARADTSWGGAVLFLVVLVVGIVGFFAYSYRSAARTVEQAHAAALAAAEQQAAARAASAAAEPDRDGATGDASDASDTDDELARALARNAELAARIERLEAELDVAQRERVDREMEWIDFTKALGTLVPDARRNAFTKELLSDAPGATEAEPEPDPAEVARAERSAAIRASLRALMRAEWVLGLDLLEVGLLSDEGWIGPVVFRMLDDLGRLSGGMTAQRMRLEGSRNGHVVTLVLEEGSESHDGRIVPFADGERRILLPGIDPAPWIDAVPELFSESDRVARDDGRWDVARVERELNRLLAEDASGDVYRFRHVGGVVDGVLQDVHLAVRNAAGHVDRHVFADRCRILWAGRGAQLLLEDGVTMRGDARSPFLEGRLRVYLPRGRREAWEAAGVPGMADAPPRASGATFAE